MYMWKQRLRMQAFALRNASTTSAGREAADSNKRGLGTLNQASL